MKFLFTQSFSKLPLLVLPFATSLRIPDQKSVLLRLIFLNSRELLPLKSRMFHTWKVNQHHLLEVTQLEKLPYFENSEQTNSSRQHS